MSINFEKILKGIVDYAKSDEGKKTIQVGAGSLAIGAGVGAVSGYVKAKKEDEKIIKEEKKSSFKAGIYKGLELSEEQIKYNILARIAAIYYIAWADGEIQAEEDQIINDIIARSTEGVVIEGLDYSISKLKEEKWVDMNLLKQYFNLIPIQQMQVIMDDIYDVAESSEGISEVELRRIRKIKEFVELKMASSNEKDFAYGVSIDRIDEAVDDYEHKLIELDKVFEKKTNLNKKEISLVIVAVILQAFRIYIIDELTKIEKANKSSREDKIHEKQEKILSEYDNDNGSPLPAEYYAPMKQIITRPGVPYDITDMGGERVAIFSASEKGKGGNHRFSTLGHDPIIGLVVGTTNIITNTITTVREDMPLPMTYHVKYDSNYKNGKIYAVPPASFVKALEEVYSRTENEKNVITAALIKQLLHIASDLYTPTGIQLPGANLVLSRENAEALTKYISAGDALKYGTSKGVESLIDKMILAIHGCLLLDNNLEMDSSINKVKGNKIILYSKAIVESSDIISKMLFKGGAPIDWAGFSTFVSRCMSDIKFVYDIKHEFIRNGVDEKYNPHGAK